jgi:hypothetical protein
VAGIVAVGKFSKGGRSALSALCPAALWLRPKQTDLVPFIGDQVVCLSHDQAG